MEDKRINPDTITGQIRIIAFELLEKSTDGIRWKDLNEAIQKSNPDYHPKTINGTVWKLTEQFPDKIYKPSKGVFRLLKYKE